MSARKRRLSASSRVALAMSLMLALGVAALCLTAYVITLRNLDAETDRALLHEAQAYGAAIKGSADSTSLVSASRSYLRGRTGALSGPDPILLVMASGRVLSNSAVKLESAGSNLAAAEPTASAPGFADVAFDDATYRVLSTPITSTSGTRVGLFQAALSTGAARQTATQVAAALGAAGLIVIVLGAFVSVWAARGALRPLRRMAADVAGITHASPGGRVAYDGPPDELGSLATSLNQMLARLEQSYEDQRRFVADASHELRTPVAIVRGNIELLRRGTLSPDDADESLAMIDAESQRMTRLLDELLSLARLEGAARTFQPLEVRTMLDEIAAKTRRLGDRNIAVEGSCDLWISGNPDLLEQALLNIVRNALAHTHSGGHITFACDASGNRARISITDDGPGIPAAELGRIFDRFYRSAGPRPDDSGGAGLGLAIAKRLTDLHDGIITAENVAGGGARFTIDLPRIAPPG